MDQVLEVAGKIEAGEEAQNHLLQLLRRGTSMGRVRPKCTVEWEDSLWIAKFPAKESFLHGFFVLSSTISSSLLLSISGIFDQVATRLQQRRYMTHSFYD